jgi:hypothetical protein
MPLLNNCPFICITDHGPCSLKCRDFKARGLKERSITQNFTDRDDLESFTRAYCGGVSHQVCPIFKILYGPL